MTNEDHIPTVVLIALLTFIAGCVIGSSTSTRWFEAHGCTVTVEKDKV